MEVKNILTKRIKKNIQKIIYLVISLKYSETCVKRSLLKRPKISFQTKFSLNAGQKYYRMLQGEHSVILSTFIQLPFVIKIFVLSIFEWPFYSGFTVVHNTGFP